MIQFDTMLAVPAGEMYNWSIMKLLYDMLIIGNRQNAIQAKQTKQQKQQNIRGTNNETTVRYAHHREQAKCNTGKTNQI